MKNLQVASCFILVKGLFSPLTLGEQLFIVCCHLYNMPWEVKPIKTGCGLISVVVWELKKMPDRNRLAQRFFRQHVMI